MIDKGRLMQDFEAKLVFSDAPARDLCFAARCFAALYDYDRAYQCFCMAEKWTEGSAVHEALRLWAACELMRCKGSKDISAASITGLIDVLLGKIDNSLVNAEAHWLYSGMSDRYLSNYAIVYGALRDTLTLVEHDGARESIIRLRSFILKHFLKGGNLVSRVGSDEQFGDLAVCAVPFCLFGAEDRMLVEAMEEKPGSFFPEDNEISFLPGQSSNMELTLLLAWYFAEKGDLKKGDLVKAKALFGTGAALSPSRGKEALSSILSAFVELKIEQKETRDRELSLVHVPAGTDDPYYTARHERSPRLPCEGEQVTINTELTSFNEEASVWLEYSVNGKATEKAGMNELTEDNAVYYSGNMGSFNYGDIISYCIYAEAGGRKARSRSFSYRTAKWFSCSEIIGAAYDGDGVYVYFASDVQSGIAPVLAIKAEGIAFNLELAFHEGAQKPEQLGFGSFLAGGLSICVENNCMTFFDKSLNKIAARTKNDIVSYLHDGNKVIMTRIKLSAEPGESFYGMGERYSAMEYRGFKLDNYVYNQYRDQDMKTYMPCPFYISSAGYGLYLDSEAYSTFDFCCSEQDRIIVEGYCDDNSCSLSLFTGRPREVLAAYLHRTGFPKLPPLWVFGPWMSSNNWDSQSEVLYQLEMTKQHNIPATVLVIEQWSDEATYYIFNDAKYKLKNGDSRFCESDFEFPSWGRWTNPREMADKLHAEGIKLVLWQVPLQKYMGGIAHPQRDEDERVMLEKGYCIKNADGSPYRIPYGWFAGSLVPDFTNPEACRWWLDKRRYLLEDIGVDGFKTDGGECILGDQLIYENAAGNIMHNRFVLDYVRAYQEYGKELNKDVVTFSRAGFTGAQTIPLHWAGDARSTWEAFRSSVRAGLSAGLSGITFWTWDMAGFHGDIPTAELYIRSAEMSVFCPVMQYHAETRGEFNRDRTPWNIAERTGEINALTIYRDYSWLRMNILPYIYNEAINSSNNCEPMMRAMFYSYPEDSECRSLDMQYMFGRSLLVAPVTEEGKTAKRVYLPEGRWYGLFDNKRYEKPGYYEFAAPIDTIPVFVRENSIIPLNLDSSLELFSNVGNGTTSFGNLCFDIRLADSIDESFDFGEAGKAELKLERSDGSIKVQVEASRPVILRFLNEGKPGKVYFGGKLPREDEDAWYLKDGNIIVMVQDSESDMEIRFEDNK